MRNTEYKTENKKHTIVQTVQPRRKKRGALILSLVFAVLTVCLAVPYFLPKAITQDEKLLRSANEVNKTCPILVDQATRLDNATIFPGNVFQYNYTLFNIYRENVSVSEVIKNLEPIILSKVKKDPELKEFRKDHTTLQYSYKDRNGEFIFRIIISADKYADKNK